MKISEIFAKKAKKLLNNLQFFRVATEELQVNFYGLYFQTFFTSVVTIKWRNIRATDETDLREIKPAIYGKI